jgi:hypothetical protein
MTPTAVAALVFACTFGAVLAGMRLRRVLPEEHLRGESKETVTVAVGLVATMTALVLGLVTASAKSSFDALDAAVKHTAADVLTLDRTLARYGPEAEPVRAALRQALELRLHTTWPDGLRELRALRTRERHRPGGDARMHALRRSGDLPDPRDGRPLPGPGDDLAGAAALRARADRSVS